MSKLRLRYAALLMHVNLLPFELAMQHARHADLETIHTHLLHHKKGL